MFRRLFRIRTLMTAVAIVALVVTGTRFAWQTVQRVRLARKYGEYAASFARNERKTVERIQSQENDIAETDRSVALYEIALLAKRRQIAAADNDREVPKQVLDEYRQTIVQMDELQRSKNANTDQIARDKKDVGEYAELRSYYQKLERKYQEVACYPWLTVPPDPSPPK